MANPIRWLVVLGLWACATFASESRWEASAHTGVGVVQGQLGWGVGAGALWKVEGPTPFRMGVELGLHRWDYGSAQDPFKSFSQPVQGARASLVSLLPTFVWDMPAAAWRGATPYLSLSLGPALYAAQGQVDQSVVRESMVSLLAWVRPGLRLALGRSLGANLETRLGFYRGQILLLTQLGVGWFL